MSTFVRAVRENDRTLIHTDALDALKSHELVFKIEESRLKGEVVHFYR